MNRRALITALWGLAILLIGVVGLLYNFGVFDAYALLGAYVVSGVLALGGLVFFIVLAINTQRWILTIPAFTLLSLGVLVFLTTLEDIPPEWMGALFLFGLAIGFLVLFFSNRKERWWALLQACIILVVAIVGVGVGVLTVQQLGAVLFGGLGLSFFLLYLIGGNRRALSWTLIVGAVLLIFAVALLASSLGADSLIVKFWPALLVLVGGYILARVLTGRVAAEGRKPTPTIPAEVLEGEAPAPGADAEPAQIVRPERFSQPTLPQPASPAIPLAPPQPDATSAQPATTAPPAATEQDTLPQALQSFDPDDPAAALDALLAASQQEDESDA